MKRAGLLFLGLFLVMAIYSNGQCIESPELTKPMYGMLKVWKTPEELVRDGLPPTILDKTKLWPCLASQWVGLRSGFYNNTDNKILYEDFAIVVLSTNPFQTTVTIELIDQNGFTFKDNPLTQVLEKDATLQWLASEHFTVDDGGLIFFSNLTLKVKASAPVYVLSPKEFFARGKADSVLGAIKNGWWSNFSMEVPYVAEWSQEGNRIVFPYSIHWHNFENWPEGWDTVFTIINKSKLDAKIKVKNKPLYNNIHDCSESMDGKNIDVGEKEKGFLVNPDKIEIFRLSEFLEIQDDVSHNTEGAVIFLVQDTGAEVEVTTKVVPRPSGQRLCPK